MEAEFKVNRFPLGHAQRPGIDKALHHGRSGSSRLSRPRRRGTIDKGL